MTFLAPWLLVAGGVAAVAVVAVHLLALHRPPAAPLPTARFVPDVPAHATTRAERPTDRWLLLLRVLAILLAAAAFARPVLVPERAPLRRVLLLDRSRGVASDAELRERALALFRPGDAVVVADSAARALESPTADSLRALAAGEARGSLSALLVAGWRTAAALRDSTDSVQVVLVSPLVRESFDAATPAVRASWSGGLAVARLAAARDSAGPSVVVVRAPADHPLTVAVALLAARPRQPTRVVRTAPTSADSAWAREAAGLLLVWPDSGAPAGWSVAPPDTIGAVTAGAATLVAPFVRVARAPSAQAPRAWWVDGVPAAAEAPLGDGCVRAVAVPLVGAGDLPLRPRFHELLVQLLAPCGGARDLSVAPDSILTWMTGSGPSTVAVEHDPLQRSPLVPWLLGAAIALLLAELAVRRLGSEA